MSDRISTALSKLNRRSEKVVWSAICDAYIDIVDNDTVMVGRDQKPLKDKDTKQTVRGSVGYITYEDKDGTYTTIYKQFGGRHDLITGRSRIKVTEWSDKSDYFNPESANISIAVLSQQHVLTSTSATVPVG